MTVLPDSRSIRSARNIFTSALDVSIRSGLFSSGFLWIEPNTGRILKTEFLVENPYPKQKARGQAIVTYTEDKKLGVYVPSLMIEHYETDESYVDCRADYSGFRYFNVDVKSVIGR